MEPKTILCKLKLNRKRTFHIFFYGLILCCFIPAYLKAQVADFEFVNDTVCVNEPVSVLNFSSGASTYQWVFESAIITPDADVTVIDDVEIPLTADGKGGPAFIDAIRDSGRFYTFVPKHIGDPASIWRQSYGNSFDNAPINEKILDFPINSIQGLDIEQDDDGIYYGIVSGSVTHDLYRITFENGIDTTPSLENIGFSQFTSFPHDVNLIKENGTWYSIISSSNPGWRNDNDYILTVLKFNDGLGGDVTTIDAWAFEANDLSLPNMGFTGIGKIKEDGKWHIFAASNDNVVRVEFNEDFTIARGYNLGSVDGNVSGSRDVTIINDCGKLSGFVANNGDNSLGILHFDEGIDGPVWGEKKDFSGTYEYPHSISDVYRFGGDAIVIIPEIKQGVLMKLKFTPGGGHVNAPFPDNTEFEPSGFSYNAPGNYYVALSVNNDLSSTVCQGIVVMEKPDAPAINSDPVCQGDSLKLTVYEHPEANYNWTLPDNSTTKDKYPIVSQTGDFKLYLSYGACFSPEATENVSMVPLPTPNWSISDLNICEYEDALVDGLPAGGTPPYTKHVWTGNGQKYLLNDTIENPVFNGFMGTGEEFYYLSDFEPVMETGEWKKDMNMEGDVIMIAYNAYGKGLGTTSGASAKYFLNGQYHHFRSYIGIDDAVTGCGTAKFKVFTDGSLAFESGTLTYGSPLAEVDIDLYGVDTLELIVEDAGDGDFCDLADWGGARLLLDPPHVDYDLTYTVYDSYGCKGSITKSILLDTSDVHITKQPADTSLCETADLSVSVAAYGPGPLSYQWQKLLGSWTDLSNGGNISGVNSKNLSFTSADSANSGLYRCIITSVPCGEDTTRIVMLEAIALPRITSFESGFNCGPGSVAIEAKASAGQVRWYTQAAGGSFQSVGNVFATPVLSTSVNYYAEAHYQGCVSAARAEVEAEIREIPSVLNVNVTNASECDQTDGIIEVTSSPSSGTLEYSIDSGQTWQLSPDFNVIGMGIYKIALRYNDGACEALSDSFVFVSSQTAPQWQGAPVVENVDNCGQNNGKITINVTGSTGNYLFSIDNGATWQDNGGNYVNLSPGVYNVKVKNQDGSCIIIRDEDFIVEGISMPEIELLNVTGVSDCGENDGQIIIDASGTPGATILFTVDSGMNWLPVNEYNGLSPGTYHVALRYLEYACQTEFTENEISEPVAPEIISTKVKPVNKCFDPDGRISISAQPGTGALQYSIDGGISWQNDSVFYPYPSGAYMISVQNANNTCIQHGDTVVIPKFCNDTVSDVVCKDGTQYNLMVRLTGINEYGSWTNQTLPGSVPGGTVNTAKLEEGTNVFVYEIDSSAFTLLLEAYRQKLAGTAIPGGIYSCYNEINLFKGLQQGSWDAGGTWADITSDKVLDDSIVQISPGMYEFAYRFEAQNHCPDVSETIHVEVDSEPPSILCEDIENLSFAMQAGFDRFEIKNNDVLPSGIDDNCGVRSWSNSLNNDSTLLGELLSPGEHEIMWTATDFAGNTDHCYSSIVIEAFEIYNIITPNGDGINDTWDYPIDEKYPDAIVEIYNKWGELIYVSDRGYHQKWDGRINSKLVPVDAYYFVIKNKGETIFKGSITVIYEK